MTVATSRYTRVDSESPALQNVAEHVVICHAHDAWQSESADEEVHHDTLAGVSSIFLKSGRIVTEPRDHNDQRRTPR